MFAATRIIQASKATKPAYRYWRIFITSNNGSAAYIQVDEIELRVTNGGADITTPSTPVVVSSGTQTAANYLVDNNLFTRWTSDEFSITNQWIRLDLSSPYSVSQVAIASGSGLANSTPKDFSVQGSSDGSNFTTLATFSNVTGWAVGTLMSFDI